MRFHCRLAVIVCGAIWPGLDTGRRCEAAPVAPILVDSTPTDNRPAQHAVVVRISESLLQDPERAAVRLYSDVRLNVLGTPVYGKAETNGIVSADFAHSRRNASVSLLLHGTTVAHTVGQRGPATICSVVASRFVAQKPVVFDLEHGFSTGPASVQSRTWTVSRSVQPTVPGIRGRIVERVAWDRIRRNRALLESIGDANARRRIGASFDMAATTRLVKLNARFEELRLALAANRVRQPSTQVDLFTTNRYLEICVGPKGPKQAPSLPDTELSAHPLQVWIHASPIDSETSPLLQTWDLLRRVILPETEEPSARGVQLQTARGGIPLRAILAPPWVVIGAGEPESITDVEGR